MVLLGSSCQRLNYYRRKTNLAPAQGTPSSAEAPPPAGPPPAVEPPVEAQLASGSQRTSPPTSSGFGAADHQGDTRLKPSPPPLRGTVYYSAASPSRSSLRDYSSGSEAMHRQQQHQCGGSTVGVGTGLPPRLTGALPCRADFGLITVCPRGEGGGLAMRPRLNTSHGTSVLVRAPRQQQQLLVGIPVVVGLGTL